MSSATQVSCSCATPSVNQLLSLSYLVALITIECEILQQNCQLGEILCFKTCEPQFKMISLIEKESFPIFIVAFNLQQAGTIGKQNHEERNDNTTDC